MPQIYVYSFLSPSLALSLSLSLSRSLSLFSLFQFFIYIYIYIYIYIFIIIIIIIIIVFIIIIIFIIIVYFYVSSTCTDLVEKLVRFPQGLSLVFYLYFRIFYFCIVELWVLVNLKYRKKMLAGLGSFLFLSLMPCYVPVSCLYGFLD